MLAPIQPAQLHTEWDCGDHPGQATREHEAPSTVELAAAGANYWMQPWVKV